MNEGSTEIRYASTEPAYPCTFFSDHEDCHLVRFADDHGSAPRCFSDRSITKARVLFGVFPQARDDFGTSYSALSYLRNLPVTAVKLDKSFLVDIPHDRQGRAVIKAVMDISSAPGLETIAEGVETEEQAAFLKENNCTGFQGFLVSRPLAASDMTTWLSDKSAIRH